MGGPIIQKKGVWDRQIIGTKSHCICMFTCKVFLLFMEFKLDRGLQKKPRIPIFSGIHNFYFARVRDGSFQTLV